MSTVPPALPGGGALGSRNIGGFGYGLGLSVGILLLITTITLTAYFCIRLQGPTASTIIVERRQIVSQGSPEYVLEIGLDEATISSYPKILYSQAKINNKDSTATCCSICLADYKGSDTLRLLPDCKHLFHLKCVDPWLRQHPTCPVCRTSPLLSPMTMPQAEVAPLANRPVV